MLFSSLLRKDICPGVDEEAYAGCIADLPRATDTINLVNCLAQLACRWKTVLQVAPYGSCVDRQPDGFADCVGRITITALQIQRHW